MFVTVKGKWLNGGEIRKRERKEQCVGKLVECQGMRDIVTIPAVLNIYFEKKTET